MKKWTRVIAAVFLAALPTLVSAQVLTPSQCYAAFNSQLRAITYDYNACKANEGWWDWWWQQCDIQRDLATQDAQRFYESCVSDYYNYIASNYGKTGGD